MASRIPYNSRLNNKKLNTVWFEGTAVVGGAFLYRLYVKGNGFIKTFMPIQTQNYNQYLSFMVDKSYISEYISKNSSQNEELCMQEELSTISRKDETIVIKYLLDIMKAHDIITEEEYRVVLYKYS